MLSPAGGEGGEEAPTGAPPGPAPSRAGLLDVQWASFPASTTDGRFAPRQAGRADRPLQRRRPGPEGGQKEESGAADVPTGSRRHNTRAAGAQGLAGKKRTLGENQLPVGTSPPKLQRVRKQALEGLAGPSPGRFDSQGVTITFSNFSEGGGLRTARHFQATVHGVWGKVLLAGTVPDYLPDVFGSLFGRAGRLPKIGFHHIDPRSTLSIATRTPTGFSKLVFKNFQQKVICWGEASQDCIEGVEASDGNLRILLLPDSPQYNLMEHPGGGEVAASHHGVLARDAALRQLGADCSLPGGADEEFAPLPRPPVAPNISCIIATWGVLLT